MKKSDELRAKISDMTDQAERIVNSAEAAGRDFTAAEQATWNKLMAKETGQVAMAQVELEAAVRDEDEKNRLRSAKLMSSTPIEPHFDSTGARPYTGTDARVIEPKLSCYKSTRDAHDCGLWLKANILRNGEAREKLEARRGQSWVASQNESSPVDGGYLVPAPLSNAIIIAREQTGALRKLAQIYPMTADTLAVPKRTAGLTVYYPGEEGSITESDADFGRVNLTAKKRAVLTYISNELNDDSLVPIMDVITAEMGQALALKEDGEFIDGDGTSTYGGEQGIKSAITAATASISQFATGHDTWAEIDISDLTHAMSKLSDKYRIPGQLAWLCSAAFKWQVFDRLAIGANGAITQVWVDGQPVEMFLGYPVVLSDRCPTSGAAATLCGYFGNFKQAVALGDRSGVRVALSEHVAFTTDRLALRATVRYDLNVHGQGDTSTAGAIIGLKTAA